MANNLYDTGKPQKIIVEHRLKRVSRNNVRRRSVLDDVVEFANRVQQELEENLRQYNKKQPIIDAEFEVIEEPKRKQLK